MAKIKTSKTISFGELFNVLSGVDVTTPFFWRADYYKSFEEAESKGDFAIGCEVAGSTALCSVVENAAVVVDSITRGQGQFLRAHIVIRGIGYDISRESVSVD